MTIQIKRIYDQQSEDDGFRVLVDRLWPRGISKEKASLDEWLKELGPSNELRKWFNHEDEKFEQFKEKYIEELKVGLAKESFDKLQKIVKENKKTTLLYAAKNTEHNQAVVLLSLLEK